MLAKLVEGLLECRVQLRVLPGRSQFSSEFVERLVRLPRERGGSLASLDDDQPKQGSLVSDGCDADADARIVRELRRQPCARPGIARDACVGENGFLLRRQGDQLSMPRRVWAGEPPLTLMNHTDGDPLELEGAEEGIHHIA